MNVETIVAFTIGLLQDLNEVVTAVVAVTAFSLLIYALTFNLRDRVARSFAIIMFCVVIVFSGEALGSASSLDTEIEVWLRFQWVGIVILPAAFLQLSDALLATTGRPSRGRRRFGVRMAYALSLIFLLALQFGWLVGPLATQVESAPHLSRSGLSWVFAGYYILSLLVAALIFQRAFRRAVTKTSRHRLRYLLIGALAPALGSFPYMLYGSEVAAFSPFLFWWAALISNAFSLILLVMMAYGVAFFGVPWPDRVIKRRLFKWLLRGTVTASSVLALTTLVRRVGAALGFPYSGLVPLTTVVSVLVISHMITLLSPVWERWLFHGGGRADLTLLQGLEERIITPADLSQFLESVLAAACDQFQVRIAFVAIFDQTGLETIVAIGKDELMETEDLSQNLLAIANGTGQEELFSWGRFWLLPLYGNETNDLLGLMGVLQSAIVEMDRESQEALVLLGQRAALALEEGRLQQEVLKSLKLLDTQAGRIQRLRAAARYDKRGVLADLEDPAAADYLTWVKDALRHYWGGPKLSKNPLVGLEIVQKTLQEHEGNTINALRSILRQAIERVRPEGERRFTGEWILYNILEMKFMEGRKVREIALRLAMSEADLYRKQRIAIEVVAEAIVEMERQAIDDIAEGGSIISGIKKTVEG